jgi:hypothetical protein
MVPFERLSNRLTSFDPAFCAIAERLAKADPENAG